MLTLQPDDKRLEYRNENDLLVDVYFNNEKFSGILKNDWEHIEYKDGVAHGKVISYYKTGETRVIAFYEKGIHLKTSKYYRSGILNSETIIDPYSYKVWNCNSFLVRENNKIYYNNGQIKTIYGNEEKDDFIIKTFTKKGDLMFVVLKDTWVEGKLIRNVNYEDSIMFDNYFELLIEENPELADSEEKNDTHYIWMWFWKVFDSDGNRYLEIINKLMTHPESEVKKTVASIIASHKFNDHIAKENNENKECYKFIREYTKYQNDRDPNREIKQIKI